MSIKSGEGDRADTRSPSRKEYMKRINRSMEAVT